MASSFCQHFFFNNSSENCVFANRMPFACIYASFKSSSQRTETLRIPQTSLHSLPDGTLQPHAISVSHHIRRPARYVVTALPRYMLRLCHYAVAPISFRMDWQFPTAFPMFCRPHKGPSILQIRIFQCKGALLFVKINGGLTASSKATPHKLADGAESN